MNPKKELLWSLRVIRGFDDSIKELQYLSEPPGLDRTLLWRVGLNWAFK